jgi:hypothetical protein
MLKLPTRRWTILAFVSVILCGAVVASVAVVHRTRLSIWLLAHRSEAIAYADFPAGTDGTHAYIREIWKQARGPEKLSVGTAITVGPPFSVLAHDPPEAVILFFDDGRSREFSHLRGSTRLFFRDDHLWWPGSDITLTLAGMRALCRWHIRI